MPLVRLLPRLDQSSVSQGSEAELEQLAGELADAERAGVRFRLAVVP
jgi:hypothetical protein